MLLMKMCLLLLLCVGRERRGERGEGRCAAGDPLLCMVSARSRYEGVFFFFFSLLFLVIFLFSCVRVVAVVMVVLVLVLHRRGE